MLFTVILRALFGGVNFCARRGGPAHSLCRSCGQTSAEIGSRLYQEEGDQNPTHQTVQIFGGVYANQEGRAHRVSNGLLGNVGDFITNSNTLVFNGTDMSTGTNVLGI